MPAMDAEFLKKLKAAFKVEAMEHVRTISSGLIELEKNPGLAEQKVIFENTLRDAHSLKGASRVVNLTFIETICQLLEDILSALKRQTLSPSSNIFDLLHSALDAIGLVVVSPEDEVGTAQQEQIATIIGELTKLKGEASHEAKEKYQPTTSLEGQEKVEVSRPEIRTAGPPPDSAGTVSTVLSKLAGEKANLPDTLRISTRKLDMLFLQAEEMISLKLIARQHSDELSDMHSMFASWHKEWTKLNVELRSLRQLLDVYSHQGDEVQLRRLSSRLLEFLDWNHAHLKLMERKLLSLKGTADHDMRYTGTLTDSLLEESKKLLMLPCSTLFDVFPKVVRDLSRDQGKEVEISISGMEVQIDKRILEELKDPLIHMLRNCLDHGIEKAQERIKKGKSAQGKILIKILPLEGNMIEILVADDGAGIELEKVKEAAVKNGIISSDDLSKLNEQETLLLIFQSAISTSRIITEISGRGLGLAIVKEKVEKLGGRVEVESTVNVGTNFRLVLPVTLATSRGVFVNVSGQTFIVPTANIERVVRIKRDEIKTVENRDTILLEGRAISFVWLADLLELPRKERQTEAQAFVEVVILNGADKRVACGVEQVLSDQEVIVKSLSKPLVRARNIAGATISGAGKIVPILNVGDLMKSATKVAAVAVQIAPPSREEKELRTVLVVEDSITARMLIKNVLEMAGYEVKTAVDGIDAWTILKTGSFDLVVSDVEMPRMNGFDLTAKIRSDKKLGEMPVVLVTALASREDRERGIDVGANAYIVKSTFDQSNLIEVIERLI